MNASHKNLAFVLFVIHHFEVSVDYIILFLFLRFLSRFTGRGIRSRFGTRHSPAFHDFLPQFLETFLKGFFGGVQLLKAGISVFDHFLGVGKQ